MSVENVRGLRGTSDWSKQGATGEWRRGSTLQVSAGRKEAAISPTYATTRWTNLVLLGHTVAHQNFNRAPAVRFRVLNPGELADTQPG